MGILHFTFEFRNYRDLFLTPIGVKTQLQQKVVTLLYHKSIHYVGFIKFKDMLSNIVKKINSSKCAT